MLILLSFCTLRISDLRKHEQLWWGHELISQGTACAFMHTTLEHLQRAVCFLLEQFRLGSTW